MSIVPAADNDDWQLHVYSPKKREFSTLLIGTDGQHTPVFIRDYIERALQQSEKHVSAGASATTTSAILEKSSSTGKVYILGQFKILSGDSGGIESWLTHDTDEQVFTRLSRVASEPLSKVQLNQLLLLGHEAGVSDGFFRYYWLTALPHVYDVMSMAGFRAEWLNGSTGPAFNPWSTSAGVSTVSILMRFCFSEISGAVIAIFGHPARRS